VVTPYEGQRSYISHLFTRQQQVTQDSSYAEIEIASVDSFQGREKDFILLTCVRSNQNQGIGFLNDPRRLNVALTRARYGMVICGNAKVLGRLGHGNRESLWGNLLAHFKKYDLVVEGTLSNLRPSMMTFQRPVRPDLQYFARSNIGDALDGRDNRRGNNYDDPDYQRGQQYNQNSMSASLQAPSRYFNPMFQSQSQSQASNMFPGSSKRDGKKKRRSGGSQSQSQSMRGPNGAYGGASQMSSMLSQDSFGAFDDIRFHSQDVVSQAETYSQADHHHI